MSRIPENAPHFVRSTGQQQQPLPEYPRHPHHHHHSASFPDQYSPKDTVPAQQQPVHHPGFHHRHSIPPPPPHLHHPHPHFQQQYPYPPQPHASNPPVSVDGAAMDGGPWASAASDIRFRVPIMNAEERERKRRISHSAMERRRRERTNTIINELKNLIPWLRNEARLQKLEVLEQCVCYIKELQSSSAGLGGSSGSSNGQLKRRREEDEGQASDDYTSPSPFDRRRAPMEDTAALPRASSPGASAASASSSIDASTRLVSPAAGRTKSPVHPQEANSTPVSPSLLAEPSAEEDSVVYWDAPGQLTSSDLPDLSTDSGASSKASSTVSTITPFRGPLPKDIAESTLKCTDAGEGQEPRVKNSIDFLTS
ncbi:hypothetical protein GQ54DRAFT_178270 [Martensiomyces pterosporus]|nr:hypothetical protein GQ54DRAFT_178270 [Martensiomyces pterosporus]